MLRLRNAVAGLAAGLMLTVAGAATASADPPPECADHHHHGPGIHVIGSLDLGGILGGLLGGHHGHCCPDDGD